MRVLKQKRTILMVRYEGQRVMLDKQTSNLDQVSFAAEGNKDAQQTQSMGQSSKLVGPGISCKLEMDNSYIPKFAKLRFQSQCYFFLFGSQDGEQGIGMNDED
ncbi:hypothetical protein Leryth_014617 [Lithospermum erythrorhizon]|nr:hypothetical protein Leryth_014617 [Lithospermum erythrorhizon]